MPILYPDILEHNNSAKALVDITQLRGSSYPVGILSETGSIPTDKRKVGAIIFVSSSQQFYGFYGQTTGSADWDSTSNWRTLSTFSGSYTGSFSGSFVGNLTGTSSYATNALSSSYALTASYVLIAQTASYVLNAVSSSFSATASYVQNAQTASYLNTLNQDLTFNGNLTLNGTASITYLNVSYESASVIYSSGSNQFGDAANDTQTLYGSVIIPTGSLTVTGSVISTGGFTGSLQGTASFASTASFVASSSYALSSSFASTASFVASSSYALSSSFASTASFSVSSSYALSASNAQTASFSVSSSYALSASNAQTASFVQNAVSSSYALSSSFALTASFATTASFASTASFVASSSYALSSSFATTASFALTASFLNSTTNAFIQNGNSFGTTALLGTNDSQSLALETSGSTRMFISSSGNIGIGTLTPTGLLHIVDAGTSFTTPLQLNSYFKFRGDGVMSWGTSMNQGILSWDTGKVIIGASANNNLELYANGSAKVFVSGSGNIGIGTTTPTYKLHVANGDVLANQDVAKVSLGAQGTSGDVHFGSSGLGAPATGSQDYGFYAAHNAYRDSTGAWKHSRTSTVPAVRLLGSGGVSSGNSGFSFDYSANTGTGSLTWTNLMQITTAGNVGIGTTTPNAKLDISGSVNISGSGTQVPLRVSSGSTSLLFVSSSGRVGIGTITPRELLHVAGGNIALDGVKYIDFGSGNSRINDLGLIAGQGYPITISTFGPIGTGTANSLTEKLRLTGSGSLGLGTTSPSARFHISGGFTDGNLMRVQSPTGAEYFFISASGNVGIGTLTPTAKLDINGNTIITGSLAISASIFQYSNNASITSGSTANIASFLTSSFTAGFFDFVATSGTNARAGTVFTVWNANNVEYAETSTNDIGNTTNLLLSASISAGAIRLQGTSLSGSWNVKTLTRMI